MHHSNPSASSSLSDNAGQSNSSSMETNEVKLNKEDLQGMTRKLKKMRYTLEPVLDAETFPELKEALNPELPENFDEMEEIDKKVEEALLEEDFEDLREAFSPEKVTAWMDSIALIEKRQIAALALEDKKALEKCATLAVKYHRDYAKCSLKRFELEAKALKRKKQAAHMTSGHFYMQFYAACNRFQELIQTLEQQQDIHLKLGMNDEHVLRSIARVIAKLKHHVELYQFGDKSKAIKDAQELLKELEQFKSRGEFKNNNPVIYRFKLEMFIKELTEARQKLLHFQEKEGGLENFLEAIDATLIELPEVLKSLPKNPKLPHEVPEDKVANLKKKLRRCMADKLLVGKKDEKNDETPAISFIVKFYFQLPVEEQTKVDPKTGLTFLQELHAIFKNNHQDSIQKIGEQIARFIEKQKAIFQKAIEDQNAVEKLKQLEILKKEGKLDEDSVKELVRLTKLSESPDVFEMQFRTVFPESLFVMEKGTSMSTRRSGVLEETPVLDKKQSKKVEAELKKLGKKGKALPTGRFFKSKGDSSPQTTPEPDQMDSDPDRTPSPTDPCVLPSQQQQPQQAQAQGESSAAPMQTGSQTTINVQNNNIFMIEPILGPTGWVYPMGMYVQGPAGYQYVHFWQPGMAGPEHQASLSMTQPRM